MYHSIKANRSNFSNTHHDIQVVQRLLLISLNAILLQMVS